ncbi:MAG: heat shock protein GrpE [Firmicutes bacterium ADurb.BinA205]|nr:MAG: heat shock protein GrpE [Firmicutes bacterium ADurb.BinA205]
MAMIFNQFKAILDKLDVKEVDGLGSEFNPQIHNAVSKTDSEDYASNRICQVYQKGYKLGDKLIRPAMVAVAN